MSRFAELVGNDIGQWKAYVEGLLVTDQAVIGDRLDELQAAVHATNYRLSWGPEIEFCLKPNNQGVAVPNADEFYDEFVEEVCDGVSPLVDVPKGRILDPSQESALLVLGKKREGTYHWENGWLEAFYEGRQIKQIMEAKIYPSFDWRESERRRWLVMGTAGRLAVKYNCRAKIMSTHERVAVSFQDRNDFFQEDFIFGNSELLLAIQDARSLLQPLESYSGMYPYSSEAYPSKAAQWVVERSSVEGRFPVFGIHDTRLQKLGAFAGFKRFLEGKEPWGQGQLSRCQKVSCQIPGLGPLFELMVWDKSLWQMVLPQDMSRSNILAGYCSKEFMESLDNLAGTFGRNTQDADFSANDAQVLRQAVSELELLGSGKELHFNPTRQNRHAWRSLFESRKWIFVKPGETVRIAHPLPEDNLMPYKQARTKAASSPEVAEILGPDVLRVLTPPSEAHNARARLVRTALSRK